MIAASAAWSTSVTKSFGALVLTFSRSRSSEARLMIAPAARAALMAMLSMGCSACDMGGCGQWEAGGAQRRAARPTIAARCKMSDRNFNAPMRPMPPTRTRFVLIGTSHAGNVGAAARAMKVMGFADLVLVAPRCADVLRREEAIAMASGAADVLAARARRRHAGRSAGRRDLRLRHGDDAARLRPADTSRRASTCRRWRPAAQRVAFVFGSRALRHGQRGRLPLPCLPDASRPTRPTARSTWRRRCR